MLLKHHKAQKKPTSPTNSKTAPRSTDDKVAAGLLPTQAEQLLKDPKNVKLFEDVLSQVNAFYDLAFNNGKEVLPIFVGITPLGLMVELSAVRDRELAGSPVDGQSINVFTYMLGTDLQKDIEPRQIAEVNMVKGQELIRLQSDAHPMPDASEGKALATWRFTDAETIQLGTMGIYEVQPENYSELSYGNGIEALGGTKEPISPLQDFREALT